MVTLIINTGIKIGIGIFIGLMVLSAVVVARGKE